MPNLNGTGPQGNGPRTGRGLGKCSSNGDQTNRGMGRRNPQNRNAQPENNKNN